MEANKILTERELWGLCQRRLRTFTLRGGYSTEFDRLTVASIGAALHPFLANRTRLARVLVVELVSRITPFNKPLVNSGRMAMNASLSLWVL
jgi:hypothetical protein